MLMEADLPEDVDALRGLVLEQARELDTLKAAQATADAEVERLRAIIEAFQRHRFGRRSEQLDPGPLALALEDLDADLARIAESDPVTPTVEPLPTGRKPLPTHLDREERLLDIETNTCACCGGSAGALRLGGVHQH